jgi:general stress protein YciG
MNGMSGMTSTSGISGTSAPINGKSRRGFASMDPARQREIASRGGRAAHEKGTAHEWSSAEAREAGRKGGVAVSQDRAHMAAIGREGGESRSAAARLARQQLLRDRDVPLTMARDGLADVPRPTSTTNHLLANRGFGGSATNGVSLGGTH